MGEGYGRCEKNNNYETTNVVVYDQRQFLSVAKIYFCERKFIKSSLF